jgi:hypothetical protein
MSAHIHATAVGPLATFLLDLSHAVSRLFDQERTVDAFHTFCARCGCYRG